MSQHEVSEVVNRWLLAETGQVFRISAPADKTKQITRLRDELTVLLEETPTIDTPDPTQCQALRDHIGNVLDADEPNLARQYAGSCSTPDLFGAPNCTWVEPKPAAQRGRGRCETASRQDQA